MLPHGLRRGPPAIEVTRRISAEGEDEAAAKVAICEKGRSCRIEASESSRVSARTARIREKTLAKLACIGGGPVYRLFGRIPLYTSFDLDAYADSKLGKPVRSTSEYGDER